jgi:hypothetical protein
VLTFHRIVGEDGSSCNYCFIHRWEKDTCSSECNTYPVSRALCKVRQSFVSTPMETISSQKFGPTAPSHYKAVLQANLKGSHVGAHVGSDALTTDRSARG